MVLNPLMNKLPAKFVIRGVPTSAASMLSGISRPRTPAGFLGMGKPLTRIGSWKRPYQHVPSVDESKKSIGRTSVENVMFQPSSPEVVAFVSLIAGSQ
jgi:hypothetical protein